MGNMFDFSEIEQPQTYEERHRLARMTCDELNPTTTIVIDDMENTVREAYGGLPNSAFIIDRGGEVVHKENWASIEGWAEILDNLLK
jgi:hypothetical protein